MRPCSGVFGLTLFMSVSSRLWEEHVIGKGRIACTGIPLIEDLSCRLAIESLGLHNNFKTSSPRRDSCFNKIAWNLLPKSGFYR